MTKVNEKPKTHKETMEAAKVATPCAAWHITFGGRYLNCGFDPLKVEGA